MFIKHHQLDAEVSLDDVHGIVQGMEHEGSLSLTLALVLGFVRKVFERVVAALASFNIVRALILLRCVKLVSIHVSCVRVLAAIREIFVQMNQLLKPAAQESCLVTGIVEWLQVLLDGEESLADWVL
jgi:hypothetical protein